MRLRLRSLIQHGTASHEDALRRGSGRYELKEDRGETVSVLFDLGPPKRETISVGLSNVADGGTISSNRHLSAASDSLS